MLFPPPENKRRGQRRPWGWTPSFRYAVSEERKCLSPKSKQIMEINKKQGFRVFGSHSPSTCLSHFFYISKWGGGESAVGREPTLENVWLHSCLCPLSLCVWSCCWRACDICKSLAVRSPVVSRGADATLCCTNV